MLDKNSDSDYPGIGYRKNLLPRDADKKGIMIVANVIEKAGK